MGRWQALTRREVLKLGMAAGAAAGGPSAALARNGSPRQGRARKAPQNIIFMVSDGMSAGVPSLAEPFSRNVRGIGTHFHALLADPQVVRGYLTTHSLNSLVTDSAAAATAWGSGSRVFNGAINVLPDGTRLTPIAHLINGSGRRTGLVTTTRITHATPAGFAAVQPNRDDEDQIAPQYAGVVDVLLGGGRKFFHATGRKDRRDVVAEYVARNYAHWSARSQMRQDDGSAKVLGLFSDGHLPYVVDQRNRPALEAEVPTLAEMTHAALSILGQSPRGFFLLIEGGRIDHAAHLNDAAAMLWEQLAFDDAIGPVRSFSERHPETLVVITTDHGNANPGLNGMGNEYGESTRCFERIGRATASFEEIRTRIRTAASQPATGAVIEIVRAATSIELSEREARAVCDAIAGDGAERELNRQHASFEGALGQVLGNYNGIGWTGTTHTADLAMVMAFGPGSDAFAGLSHHTSVFERLTAMMDVHHENPRMSPEEARKYLAMTPAVKRPHYA